MKQASPNLIVARRSANGGWRFVMGFAEGEVQSEYDRGTVELAQGRVDGVMCLFRIPRNERALRSKYFGLRLTENYSPPNPGSHRVVSRIGR